MKAPEDFLHFIEQTLSAIAHSDLTDAEKIQKLYVLVSQFFVTASEDEPLHFTTLFARITHICTRFQLPGSHTRRIQRFRIDAESFLRKGVLETTTTPNDIWILGAYALHDVAASILKSAKSATTFKLIGHRAPEQIQSEVRIHGFKRIARLVAYDIDIAKDMLIVSDEDGVQGDIMLRYGDAGRAELYKENVLQAVSLIGLPFSLSAIDVEIHVDGSYSPRILVIEPDYLVDISTIAECYLDSGGDARVYLPHKYQEPRSSAAILIGKVANFFLDELIREPSVTFEALFPKSFFLNPIEFATLTDDEVLYMTKECKIHFTNLKTVVLAEFEKLRLDRNKMYIEPAFFCPAYGLQGRLDLFLSERNHKQIIELKSGQPFMPNTYGLTSTHYAQTLLYDLMIRAVYDFQAKQTCYILYSRPIANNLRYAPPVEAIQREVIRLRNDIILIESALRKQEVHDAGWFEKISLSTFPETKGFLQREITSFENIWNSLTANEKKYIRTFSRFIAKEQYLAKVGTHGSDQANGLASLWLDTIPEKEDRFTIYKDLVLKHIETREENDTYLVFALHTNALLANFRIGDIAVLYPMLPQEPAVLHAQVYKCTVTNIHENQITVRLRSRQTNYDDLQAHSKWILEHDLYDRTFDTMHSALFALAKSTSDKRDLFLGYRPPRAPKETAPINIEGIGERQNLMIQRMIAAEEYFLLWGPPGTGKTSVVLHHLVNHYLQHTKCRLMLLAYTNRAVDEICESINALGNGICDQYVRIGSHIGTGPAFQDQLLSHKIKGMTKRKQIVGFLQSQRIIVGTISSIAGKSELFKIVKADIGIIDEASQILEPMLAGLLPSFRKWVLIGDHRQLPAVVAQSVAQTSLAGDAMLEIALEDPRDSYFERMYALCKQKKWDWAYGSLIEQGRMHAEIMAFPSKAFYDNQLQLLETKRHQDRDYLGPIKTINPPSTSQLSQALASKRLIWIPSTSEPLLQFGKTHDQEAEMTVRVVQELMNLYDGVPQIGIITPFRAQIANIRACLQKNHIQLPGLTVDTVERYQGSARDIIILSLSIHHPSMLQRIVSLSRDGVDRKLNVALTRARNQFILIGSEQVVKFNRMYDELCRNCFTLNPSTITNPVARQQEMLQ